MIIWFLLPLIAKSPSRKRENDPFYRSYHGFVLEHDDAMQGPPLLSGFMRWHLRLASSREGMAISNPYGVGFDRCYPTTTHKRILTERMAVYGMGRSTTLGGFSNCLGMEEGCKMPPMLCSMGRRQPHPSTSPSTISS